MDYYHITKLHSKLSERIKTYESKFANELPTEVLNEIRYALRADMEIEAERLKPEPCQDTIDHVLERLNHALLCAYHDLLDGVVMDLTLYLHEIVKTRADAAIHILGPKRIEILSDINEITDIIAESRAKLSGRPEVYEKLYDEWFGKLLDHRKYLNEDALEEIIRYDIKLKTGRRRNTLIPMLGIVIGIAGLVYGWLNS